MAIDMDHDRRSDEAILAELVKFKAVTTSEKNIWAFWKQGLKDCPGWEQRNVISWVRRCEKYGWAVRVLDMVPGSPTHASRYIPDSWFPQAFLENNLYGPYAGPHSSDLVRLPLLHLYGGVWLDVTFTLFRSLDHLAWDILSDPSRPEEMATMRAALSPSVAVGVNGFIASRKACVAIKYWHEMFVQIWEGGKGSTEGAHAHRLIQHLPPYVPPNIAYNMLAMSYGRFHDYMAQVMCMERLRHFEDPAREWDGPAYFKQKVLYYDVVTEAYWGAKLTRFDGRKHYEMLLLQRDGPDADPASQEWQESEALVQGILARSSAQKLSHGWVTTGCDWLATIWDQNPGTDNAPGSFGAYLRKAAFEFEQTRQLEPVTMPFRDEAYLSGDLFDTVGQRYVIV